MSTAAVLSQVSRGQRDGLEPLMRTHPVSSGRIVLACSGLTSLYFSFLEVVTATESWGGGGVIVMNSHSLATAANKGYHGIFHRLFNIRNALKGFQKISHKININTKDSVESTF